MIINMIVSGVRSLYRSRRTNPAITAAQRAKERPKGHRPHKQSEEVIPTHRITTAHLSALADQLSDRDKAILADLERTRVLTGAQLQRLRFADIANSAQARDRRRVLQRLTDLDLVSTLDRRIGGIRAGSAGHIYTLTPAGQRLQALQRGQRLSKRLRRSRTPGAPFINHTLAISEIYVTLTEASRNHDFHVSRFDPEPPPST